MKNIVLPLIASVLLSTSYADFPSTGAVTLVGGIIKTQSVDVVKKYKRKDCPVCKGTGKYLSGDGIKWVDCGYCEPDKTQSQLPLIIETPLPSSAPNCTDGSCSSPIRRRILRR